MDTCKYINISCIYVSSVYTVVILSMLYYDGIIGEGQGAQGRKGAKYIYYAERLRAREAAGRQGVKR